VAYTTGFMLSPASRAENILPRTGREVADRK
jgi:hypothetical protein